MSTSCTESTKKASDLAYTCLHVIPNTSVVPVLVLLLALVLVAVVARAEMTRGSS